MRTEEDSTEVRKVTFAQSSAPDAQRGPNFLILVDLQLHQATTTFSETPIRLPSSGICFVVSSASLFCLRSFCA